MTRSALDIPVPGRLYVHDDLTAELDALGDRAEAARALAADLFGMLRRDPRISVLTLEEQLEALVSAAAFRPFAIALGIGRAGERVADELHRRTGWFPAVRRLGLTRVEDGAGGHVLCSTTGEPLDRQLEGLEGAASIAVVDDTIYSGLTMRAVLRALPPAPRVRTQAVCLRAVGETLATITPLAPVAAGFVAAGRRDHDVSLINASGLVQRGAIRRRDAPPLAFFERPEWLHAWFGAQAPAIRACCEALHRALEGAGAPDL